MDMKSLNYSKVLMNHFLMPLNLFGLGEGHCMTEERETDSRTVRLGLRKTVLITLMTISTSSSTEMIIIGVRRATMVGAEQATITV